MCHHPFCRVNADAVKKVDSGIAIIIIVGAATPESLQGSCRDGDQHAKDEYVSRIGEEGDERLSYFFHI